MEEKTPTYANDVTTLIPLVSLKSIDFDHDKNQVRVTFVKAGNQEGAVVASTKFANLNRLFVEAEILPGSFSAAGKIQIQDGFIKGPIRGYRFTEAKPVPEVSGRWASVTVNDTKKTVHKIADLEPLYKVGGEYRVGSFLMFQKTVKVELAKIARLAHIPAKDKKYISLDFDVTLSDGTKQGLTLLEKVTFEDKQSGVLTGLVGRVPAGYKIVPAHTIVDLTWDKAEK